MTINILSNPYIEAKRLGDYPHLNEMSLGTGKDWHGEYLSRPLHTMQDGIVGHERIYTNHSIEGEGTFPKHTHYDGWYKDKNRAYSPALFTPINHLSNEDERDLAIIVGGLADGIAVHMATGIPVLALKGEQEAGKLINDMRQTLGQYCPSVLVALDHDRAGILSAADSGVMYTYPRNYDHKTDWSDIYVNHGLEAVALEIGEAFPALVGEFSILERKDGITRLTELALTDYSFPDHLVGRTALLNHFSKIEDEREVFLAAKRLIWELRVDLTAKFADSRAFIDWLAVKYNHRMNKQSREELSICADRLTSVVGNIARDSIRVSYDVSKRHEEFKRFKSSDEAKDSIISMSGVTFLQAGHADGKTSKVAKPFLAHYREQGSQALAIAHLRSLVADLKGKFGGEHYAAVQTDFAHELALGVPPMLWGGGGVNMVSICVPSLTSGLHGYTETADVVVIDEVSQVVKFLTSDICTVETMTSFCKVVQGAKRVLCLDADLDTLTIEFFERIRPAERFNIVTVPVQHTGLKAEWYCGGSGDDYIEIIYSLAIEAIREGHKIAIATDTRIVSKAVEMVIADACPDARIININRDTSSKEEQVAFLADATAKSKEYDVLIYSPAVRSGVSIENPDFTKVFGIFGGKSITSSEAIQMLRRCRGAKEFYIGVSNSVYSTAISHDQVLRAGHEVNDQAGGMETNELYDWLCARVSELDGFNKLNFAGVMLQQLGMYRILTKLHDIDDLPEAERGIEALGAHKRSAEAIGDIERDRIKSAAAITKSEYSSRAKADNLTEQQVAEVVAYRIRDLFKCKEITDKHISLYKSGAAKKVYRMHWAMNGNPDKEKQADSIMRRKYWTVQARYLNQFAELLGFDSVSEVSGVEHEQLKDAADFIWANRRILNFLHLLPSKYISRPKFDYKGKVVKYDEVKRPDKDLPIVKAFCKQSGFLFESKSKLESMKDCKERLGENATKPDRNRVTNLVAGSDFKLIISAANQLTE